MSVSFPREHLDLAGRHLQVPLEGACLIKPCLLHFFSAANYSSYVPSIHSQRLLNPWSRDFLNADALNLSQTVNGHLFSTFLPFHVTFMFSSTFNSSLGLRLFSGHTECVPWYILFCAWNHKQAIHIEFGHQLECGQSVSSDQCRYCGSCYSFQCVVRVHGVSTDYFYW